MGKSANIAQPGDNKSLISNSIQGLYNELKKFAHEINTTSLNTELLTAHGWINGEIKFRIHKPDVAKENIYEEVVVTITKRKKDPHGMIFVRKDGFNPEHDIPPRDDVKSGDNLPPEDKILPRCWAYVNFRSSAVLAEYARKSPDGATRMLLANDVWLEGNMAFFSCFSYLQSLLSWKQVNMAVNQEIKNIKNLNEIAAEFSGPPDRNMRKDRLAGRLKADKAFGWLKDPYLASYDLNDFKRLREFKKNRLEATPEITAEQGRLLTEYFMEHGYELKKDGSFREPNLRMAKAFHYLMKNKKPVIRKNDLLAGTMTPNPICGSVTQPYTIGWGLWGELKTISKRELQRYSITDETIRILHKLVFPFWMNRNIMEVWKDKFDYPLAAKINDRFFCLNLWGLVSLSPGIPDFNKVIRIGIKGIKEEIEKKENELKNEKVAPGSEEEKKTRTLRAMKIELDAILTYTRNLAAQVKKEALAEKNSARKRELEKIHEILLWVPENPARTLYEAVQAIWIMFIGIGLDSMDDNVALGRLDQVLQPFFEAEINERKTKEERQAYIEEVIEVIGCLFMRISSHLIAAPILATWQNSAGPGTSSLVVGGVTPDGKDAVNEMTYIILKVAEMLCMDDPDMDARYWPGVNDIMYLKRVCEVNYITSGTPAIHNDQTVIESLRKNNKKWDIKDIRDWVPCGCVEPVISGKHYAATGDIDSNLMVPFAMALNNGVDPIANWKLGPETGKVESFETFDEFFEAFKRQVENLYTIATTGSRQLVKVQQEVMPAPLYSVLLEGCIENGKSMTRGGAKYNSSGAGLIGLSDIVDSLVVIKKLVFDEKKITFKVLKDALDDNFESPEYHALHRIVQKGIPRFGSGKGDGREIVQRVTAMVADFLHAQDNGRGGHYAPGYRINNNHTVYGMVSGASPSGRKYGEPFTSGLTPSRYASSNLLDIFNDVAAIDPGTVNNNYTLNVRVEFRPDDSYEQKIDHIANYVEAYFVSGGMQVQFNMVNKDTLVDAMAHPDLYPDLIARVSGYTGFYTKMMRALQLEIINRAEFHV